ncbi:MAG: DUF5679 domain-containing protein [Actinomycetes bacterium]|nr:DUF5679 domain-containing protein [Actinomycetes bacterium]
MAEAYCVKCKAKREIVDAREEMTKNGHPLLRGKCSVCGATVCKITSAKK